MQLGRTVDRRVVSEAAASHCDCGAHGRMHHSRSAGRLTESGIDRWLKKSHNRTVPGHRTISTAWLIVLEHIAQPAGQLGLVANGLPGAPRVSAS